MYKPQPLEFNPSQAVMQGAGAFSRLGDSFVQQAYQQDRAKAQDNQFQLAHKLNTDKFGYQKERDATTDNQWEQSFNETKTNNLFNQGMKVKEYEAGREDAKASNSQRDKLYGLQALEYGLKKKLYDDTQSGLGTFSTWYINQNPELKNIQGLDPKGVAKIAEFEAKKTPSEYQTILGSIKMQELEGKQQAQRDARAKSFADLSANIPMYEKLTPNQKAQYYDYYIKTGKMPLIKEQEGSSWWNSDTYSFDLGDSNTTQYNPQQDVEALKELVGSLKGK